MAEEKGFSIDEYGYTQLMEQQKVRAREARKQDDGLSPEGWTELRAANGTEFVGYDSESTPVHVCRYKKVDDENGRPLYLLILDKTPFYAESGGQTGDSGILVTSSGKEIIVKDTIKWNDLIIHKGYVNNVLTKEDFSNQLKASIDTELRSAKRRNHSATHLLQAALRKVLGDHVQQSGSKVEEYSLRFDFTHFKAVTAEELEQVERQVNDWILENLPVKTDIKDLNEAKSEGATALFGEKYSDKVRVVSMGKISKELCGGTHVAYTGQIGLFHITVETSISAGIRRIEAVTGKGALELVFSKERTLSTLASFLKTSEDKLVERVQALSDTVKELESQVKELSSAKAAGIISEYFSEAQKKSDRFPWVVKNLGEVDKDTFTQISDAVSDEIKNRNIADVVIVLGAKIADKVLFSASAGNTAVKSFGIHCGELVKTAAQKAGGGGGGSPIRAQAGGKDPLKLTEALEAVTSVIMSKAGTAK